jgi:hypothetical protein
MNEHKTDNLLICHTLPATGYVSIVVRVVEHDIEDDPVEAPEPTKVFHRYKVGDKIHYESADDPMNMRVGVIEKLRVVDGNPLVITYLVNNEWITEKAIWKCYQKV